MTEAVQLEMFHTDSSVLGSVFGAMSGGMNGGGGVTSFGNPVTGLGTARDPSQYFQITEPYLLNHNERLGLLEGSRISQNIVNVYPMESSWGITTFTGTRQAKNANQAIQGYFDNFRLGSLHSQFIEVSVEARLHGEAYLLLGAEDGQSYDQELDFNNILSFTWVKPFCYNNVKVDEKNPNIYIISLGYELVTETTETIIPDKDLKKIEVHKSRVLKFVGDYAPISLLRKRKKHSSSLQCAFDGFALAMQAMLSCNAMMSDHSLFWYKLQGLAQLIKQKKYDELYSRFLTLQMSKSVLKGLAMDANNEDAGFVNRNYGGVKDILEVMMDYLVAETGIVRYKVLGSSNRAGLGAEGRGIQDRLQHSLNIKAWQRFTWEQHLLYCNKIALLSKDGITRGVLPRDLMVAFPPVLELSPDEIADLINAHVGWAEKAIDAGILDRLEARLAIFSSMESMITPNVNLDARVTELLESELEARVDPDFNDPDSDDIDLTPENLEGDDDLPDFIDPTNFSDPDAIDTGVLDRQDAAWMVWFKGRNTCTVVSATSRSEAISKARNKNVAGSKGRVVEARQPTAEERKQIGKGTWVRTRPKKYGGTATAKKSDPFKFRPQLRNKVRTDEDSQQTYSQFIKENVYDLMDEFEIELSHQDVIEYDEKKKKWLLYDSNKSRVLGTYRTEEEAKRREKQIQFFKYLKTHPEAKTKVDALYNDEEPNKTEFRPKITSEQYQELKTKLTLQANVTANGLDSFLKAL